MLILLRETRNGFYKSGMLASMLKAKKSKQGRPLQTMRRKNCKFQNIMLEGLCWETDDEVLVPAQILLELKKGDQQ